LEIEKLYEKYVGNNINNINPALLVTIRSNLVNASGENIIDDLISIGYLQVNTNQLDNAIEIFSNLIEYNPNLIAPYLGIGSSYAIIGDLDNAIISFTNAIKIDSTVADAWKRRGQTRTAKNLLHDALLDFNRAIELYPDSDTYSKRFIISKNEEL
jgi:tetratricopeptide (TPR) repeat protein